MWAILMDLDQTLVHTDMIEVLRRKRDWQEVYRSVDQTTLPPKTHSFIDEASKIGKLGIVTSSPRIYAEKLLAYHSIDIPVLIAYHDVKSHKPCPEPIEEAVNRIGVPAERCFYIGDLEEDVLAALHAKVAPIVIRWDKSEFKVPRISREIPVFHAWREVLDYLIRIIREE